MHPVERKLQFQIVPYFIVADRLRNTRAQRVFTFYSFTGEAFAILGSLGISNPVVRYLSDNRVAAEGTVIGFLGSGWIAAAGIGFLLSWGLMKFYIQSNGLGERTVRLNQFIREITPIRIAIEGIISEQNPMPKLITEQIKLVSVFDKYRAEGVIPPEEPDLKKYRDKAKAYTENLIRHHIDIWDPPPIGPGRERMKSDTATSKLEEAAK